MKKFATPLAIKGTKEELLSLVPKLEELGYKSYYLTDDWNERQYLVTNHDEKEEQFTNLSGASYHLLGRLKVSASNPDLVLALAAMVEGKKVEVGEYIHVVDGGPRYANGFFGKIIEKPKTYPLRYGGQTWGANGIIYLEMHDRSVAGLHPQAILKKATVQEIMDHFSKPHQGTIVKEKKLVGYNVKKGVNKEALAKALGAVIPKTFFEQHGIIEIGGHYATLIERYGFQSLFEPVYEEEKTFIEIAYGKTKSTRKKLKIEIIPSSDGILAAKARVANQDFTKSELQRVLNTFTADGVKFKPTYFNVGCTGQYENVSAEDIQKVIDAM